MTLMTMLLAIIFIIVIMMSLTASCSTASPYYADNIFQKHSTFESFSNNSTVLDYSSKGDNKAMDTYKPHLIQSPPSECKKNPGLNGLYCDPNVPLNPIDKFGNTEGKADCTDNLGLTRSTGGLCLSEQQKLLFSTRGGNSTCNVEVGH